GRVVVDDAGRTDSGWQDIFDRLADRGELRDRKSGIRTGLEIEFQETDAVVRDRLDVIDPVDRGGSRALADVDDALFHFLRRQSGVVPHHVHKWHIDGGEDVEVHAAQ